MQERDRCSLEKPGESQGRRSLKLSLEAWRPRGALAGAGGLGWGGWEQQRIFTENLPCSCPGLYSNHTLAPCPEEEAVIQMISSEQKWQQAGNIQEMALLWDIPWKCIFTKDRLPWWVNNKESTCNAGVTGDAVSIPGSGRSPGGGHGNPLWYSCLENPTDRGTWRAAVCGVAKGQTRLKQLSTHTHTHTHTHTKKKWAIHPHSKSTIQDTVSGSPFVILCLFSLGGGLYLENKVSMLAWNTKVGLDMRLFLPWTNPHCRPISCLLSEILGHQDPSFQRPCLQNCSHLIPEFML